MPCPAPCCEPGCCRHSLCRATGPAFRGSLSSRHLLCPAPCCEPGGCRHNLCGGIWSCVRGPLPSGAETHMHEVDSWDLRPAPVPAGGPQTLPRGGRRVAETRKLEDGRWSGRWQGGESLWRGAWCTCCPRPRLARAMGCSLTSFLSGPGGSYSSVIWDRKPGLELLLG